MVIPMQVQYRSVTLECGHVESFFAWYGDTVTQTMCHRCHRLRAVVGPRPERRTKPFTPA